MMWRGLWLLLWIGMVTVGWTADPNESTLAYLKAHPEDWPKQLLLKEAVPFKLLVDGKEAGSMQAPALSTVILVGVGDDKLEISNGVSTSTVEAGKTDLWERVTAIRTEREKRPDPARDDPAMKLTLPVNSEPADWYKTRLDTQIKPWLEKYSTHKLAPKMKEIEAGFTAEYTRVAAGEVRRGNRWYNAAEAAAHHLEFELEDFEIHLREAVAAKDTVRLRSLLVDVDRQAKSVLHPKLLRAAHTAARSIQSTLADEAARRPFAEWLKKWPMEEADAEEKALEQLKRAATLEPEAAAAVLVQVDKVWPGNEVATQLYLDIETKLLQRIDTELAAGRIEPALKDDKLLEQLVVATKSTSAQFESINKRTQALREPLTRGRELLAAYERKEFDRLLESGVSANSPIAKWHTGLKATVVRNKEDSSRQISDADHHFLHLRFEEARTAFAKAKELWPENPEIASRERTLVAAKWLGIFLGAILVLSLLSYAYTFWDHYRFKRMLKRKAKEAEERPREF